MGPDHHTASIGGREAPEVHLPRRDPHGPLFLLITLWLISGAAEARDRADTSTELVRWSTRATAMMLEGDLSGAVQSLARARQASAIPELDALVGLAGLMGAHQKEALAQLTAAIEHGSTEPMVFYWTSRAAWSLGHRALARRRMHQAATLAPQNSTILMGQTLMLLAAEKRVQAAKALVAVAALEPNLLDPILYPTPLEGAIGLLSKVLDHPARLQIIRTQGYFYWRAKRVTAALRSFSAITQKRPRDGDALQMIARCQMALGQDSLALATAQRAVQVAPDHPHTYATRGEILLDQGQAEGAIADLQRAADHLPRDSRILTRLADACADAEKPECAKRYYAYAVERDKQNAAAHYGLAMAYQHDQKWDLAQGAFQQAISLDPGQAKFYQAASHLARLRGKVKAANQHRARAREFAALEQRHKRIYQRINRQIQRQVEALASLAAHPPCPAECVKKIGYLSAPARIYLRVHLAQKQNHKIKAQQLALTLIDQLNPRRLLNSDPSELKFMGKTSKGKKFSVRKAFPLVLPGRFK